MRLSLCMIVKDEKDFIAGSLSSVSRVMGLDDLVVVDTGSADNTKAVALEHGARVFDFTWSDDFSAARNYAAEQAAHDWIFVLDADELAAEADIIKLRLLMHNTGNVGWVSVIDAADKMRFRLPRLYNRKLYRYEGIVHEQVRPLNKNNRAGTDIDVPIVLTHHGYHPEVMKAKNKLERNERLLKKALSGQPDDPYLLYQMGKRYFYQRADLEKACEYFDRALSFHPKPGNAFVYDLVECYGYALVNTERYQQAMTLAEAYADDYADNPFFRFLVGVIYQNNGKLVQAVECFESCIGADAPDYKGVTSYLAYYNIGVILECIGMAGDAKGMYLQCGNYEPALKRLAALA